MEKAQEEPLFKTGASQEDSFYDTIETSSPDYIAANSQQSTLSPEEQEAQHEEARKELIKLEEEIFTLRTVLSAKMHQANILKEKLGITSMTEFRSDVKQGLHNMKQSEVYQKTGAAFKTFGTWSTRKFGDMRNSNTFKSFEEKMGGAYTNVKSKMKGSQSENNFHETLDSPQEEATASNPLATDTLQKDEK